MLEALLSALAGLLIGSFLNVCIHRWPRDLSVVRPRSHCPQCEAAIAWYDNIPLVSYAMLRGKCRHCGAPISARYPAVELLTALLFGFVVWRFGWTPIGLKYCVLVSILVALIFSDFEELILPDELTLGGLLIGIAFAFAVSVPDITARAIASIFGLSFGPRMTAVAESLLGAILPSTFLWLGGFLFEKIRHREGLGFGDVKMMAMIGAFLGVRGALLTLIAGSLLGSVVGVIYITATRKDAATYQLPFGSFLGVGAILVTLTGQGMLDWYAGLIAP